MSTGNADRIRAELERAASSLPERLAGYRESLVNAAMECITTTAEHDDRKTNINQRFDACLETIAKALTSSMPEAQE
jgi:hypothetical protein